MQRGRALHPYAGDKPGHMKFEAGEIVCCQPALKPDRIDRLWLLQVTIVDNSGKWWKVKTTDGRDGKVPSNYFDAITEDDFEHEL